MAACLLDLTDLSRGTKYENPAANDLMWPLHNLESSLWKAVQAADATAVKEAIRHSDALSQQPGGRTNVTRILWKAVIDSPPAFADLILSIAWNLFDFNFVDDINGRTCLHQAAMGGMLRLTNLCLDNAVPADKVDAYGRSALHYAAANGHADVCRRLLKANVRVQLADMDNRTPLVHAILRGSLECVRLLTDEASSPTNSELADNLTLTRKSSLDQSPAGPEPGPAGSRLDLSNTGGGALSRQTSNRDVPGANTSHQYFTPPDLEVGFRVPGRNVRSGTACYEPQLIPDEKINESPGLAHQQGGRTQPPISWMSGVFSQGHVRTALAMLNPHFVFVGGPSGIPEQGAKKTLTKASTVVQKERHGVWFRLKSTCSVLRRGTLGVELILQIAYALPISKRKGHRHL